jgi:hypothetical protein
MVYATFSLKSGQLSTGKRTAFRQVSPKPVGQRRLGQLAPYRIKNRLHRIVGIIAVARLEIAA